VSKVFRTIAIDYDKAGLIVVDEAHLVAKWGKGFRRLYAFTSTARHFWEGSLVCVLSNLRRPNIEDSYSRSWDVTIQRNSINRPELVYQIVFIPNKAGSTFVLFSTSMGTRRCPQKQVPKTIVFFDTRRYPPRPGCSSGSTLCWATRATVSEPLLDLRSVEGLPSARSAVSSLSFFLSEGSDSCTRLLLSVASAQLST
jgi:hypothetical protein